MGFSDKKIRFDRTLIQKDWHMLDFGFGPSRPVDNKPACVVEALGLLAKCREVRQHLCKIPCTATLHPFPTCGESS
jgi:hypothetical protein